jgi:hypothetical protein
MGTAAVSADPAKPGFATIGQNGDVGDAARKRRLGVFASWRLQTYGYTLAAVYAAVYYLAFRHGVWLVDAKGTPLFSDFATNVWLSGRQFIDGHAAALYDPAAFINLQKTLIGPSPFYYPNWTYPPIFSLIALPFAALPFVAGFIAYELFALLGCIAVVHRIVRRAAATALVLASPFTAWNIGNGQTGLLTATLVGGGLLALERRPLLAGVFIGLLTCKPQFGLLVPVALVAAGKWRAIASAVVTAVILAASSIAAFGPEPWIQWPRELAAQGRLYLMAGPGSHWGLLDTVYGLIHWLGGGDALAILAQGATTLALAVLVWRLWRSPTRYPLQAAALSAAMLIATPYAFAYEMAALAVPVAFLARDQIDHGLLPGEQTVLIASFLVALVVYPTAGSVPVGLLIVLALLALILRRAMSPAPISGEPAAIENFPETTAATAH